MDSRILYKTISSSLEVLFEKREAQAIAREVFLECTGMRWMDILLGCEILEETSNRIEGVIHQIEQGVPMQYALESAWFFGMKLKVTPDVLIPRPETEELLQWIVNTCENVEGFKIVDLCTGSGCLALGLASHFSKAEVFGIDISMEALRIAQENNRIIEKEINWVQGSVLDEKNENWWKFGKVDLIVSNPPYIPENEWNNLDFRVKNHEPSLALKVPDEDPLVFYRSISDIGRAYLRPGGTLWFEIHEQYAEDVVLILCESGYDGIEIKCDLQGKNRMILACRCA